MDKYGGKYNIFRVFGVTIERFKDYSLEKMPVIYGMTFLQNQYFWHKAIVGFIFGFFLGLVFYEFILVDLAFGSYTVYVLGLIFTLLLAIGCALSSQIRCITLLTIPSFLSKAGRHIIQAMIVSTLVTGPLANIVTNIEEIMRMYTCSNSMAYNLSQARYDLLVKPFKIAFLGTKVNTEELKDMLGSVNNVVQPFAQEIEGVDDIKFIQEENDYMDEKLNDTKRSDELSNKYKSLIRSKRSEGQMLNNTNSNSTNNSNNTDAEAAFEYQQKYFKKLEMRCENVKTGMGKMCKSRFQKFKERCEDAVHWAISWAVCWPMKLDFICDIVKMFTYGGYECDPSSDVSSSIGEGYVKLKKAGKNMQAGISEERIQYKIVDPPNFVGIYSAVTLTKEFTHEIYSKKSFADAILTTVKTILAFMFILVIKSAMNYHNMFIQFTDHDNNYITTDFRNLDARRRKMTKPTLLPPTKLERNRLVDPYSIFLSNPELESWRDELWIVITLILLCTTVLGLDIGLAWALQWINDNLEFSYIESGYHSFRVDVEGVGFVASIVRSIIKGFDFNKVVQGEVTNKPCLPKPVRLTKSTYMAVYGSCIVLCVMSYTDGYVKRLRRAICAFYYRNQEKLRIEALYKKTLAFRKRLFNRQIELIHEKAKKIEIQSDLRCLYNLQRRFPGCFLLRLIPSSRPVCVICEEEEALFFCRKAKHHQCDRCKSFYCTECYINFYYTCYICTSYSAIKEKHMQDQGLSQEDV